MKRLLALPILVLACSSYATAPPVSPVPAADAPPPPDLARVCVVRTSHLAAAVAFPTRDNGVLVGATKGPTHFCYFAAPGEHVLTMSADDEATATLGAEAGREYFLEQRVDFFFGVVHVRPVWVAPEAARALLDASDYEVLVRVPGREKLPDVQAVASAKGR